MIMKRIALALLIAILLPGLAAAQTPRPRPLTGNIVDDIKNATGGGGTPNTGDRGSLDSILMKPFQDLANFIGDDIDGAIALSTQIPEVQDGHGQQCLMAMKTFGTIFKAHPKPLTFHVATDLEALRLFQISANNLCGNPHCTQVFADLATTIQTAAPVNFSIPIPSLHDLCAKVPQIAVVDPVKLPATPSAPAAPAAPASPQNP